MGTGPSCVAQDGSKLLGSSDLPVLAFPGARTKCLTPIDLFKDVESIGFLLNSFTSIDFNEIKNVSFPGYVDYMFYLHFS